MFSDAHGREYVALRSLDEARRAPDGVVVLEGDWGGQIYVTCPASVVRCDAATLDRMLRDIDTVAWPHNREGGARVFFERHHLGAGIAGGMGGGVVAADVWVHPRLAEKGISSSSVRSVLAGTMDRLPDGG